MSSYAHISFIGIIYVGALIGFTHLERQKHFSQLVYYIEKYSQLKLVNIQNNFDNVLVYS
jgi:hypothetical protein